MTDEATLIERGYKFDEQERRIGERVVTVFKGSGVARISWTEGDIFWSVQALRYNWRVSLKRVK